MISGRVRVQVYLNQASKLSCLVIRITSGANLSSVVLPPTFDRARYRSFAQINFLGANWDIMQVPCSVWSSAFAQPRHMIATGKVGALWVTYFKFVIDSLLRSQALVDYCAQREWRWRTYF
jgi:hypothetical protein